MSVIVLGELSQLAGLVACDSNEHGLAQRYPTQVLACSRHAGDHAPAAEVLAAQAHQALYLARLDKAIDLTRAAPAAAVRHGSATLLTECLVMEAHGHAARNDARACGTVLAGEEQTFDRAARYARRSLDMDGCHVQTVLISQIGHENGPPDSWVRQPVSRETGWRIRSSAA